MLLRFVWAATSPPGPLSHGERGKQNSELPSPAAAGEGLGEGAHAPQNTLDR